MDQRIPEVKAEVNKEEERDRKGGGLWGNFTSKLGGNFSGATGGSGTGLGGLLGGGVLATKAGLVGLILVGTTVAGGLGLVGYKVLGGGSSGEGEGTYSIFEAKPKGAEGSESSASAGKGNGASDSLGMLHNANLGEEPKAEETPAEATPSEPVVNAVAGSAIAPVNHGAAAPSAAPKLGGGPRIGGLSSGGGGSGGGSSSSAGTNMPGLVASGGRGSLSGMNRSDGRAGGGGRGVANARRRGGASRQLGNVFRDNKGARSSAQAGRTYDGGGQTAGSAIGPEGGAIQGGAGQGNRGAASMNQPNPETNPNINDPPPPPGPGKDVTPWAGALQKAQMWLGIGMGLLFLGNKLMESKTPWLQMVGKFMMMGAAVFGAMAMKIGFDVAFGEFGQPLQGAAMILGGGFIVAAAASAGLGLNLGDGGVASLMEITKYVALGAIAVGFLTEPKVIKPGDKDYDRAKWREDRGDFGYQAPSEKALEKFLIG